MSCLILGEVYHGTLTHNYADVAQPPANYSTFAFWSLLSTHFVNNANIFKNALQAWELSMQDEADVDTSSFNMMEKTIKHYLRANITADMISGKAKEITQDFIHLDIIQMTAIDYLSECLDKGIYCVLTTGSYLDGLYGFVAALKEANKLPASPFLLLNGAEVSWKERKLLQANVGKFKAQKLTQTLHKKNLIPYTIAAAFGDDPYVNDNIILKQARKNCAFVIKSKKNIAGDFPTEYIHLDWNEFVREHKARILETS